MAVPAGSVLAHKTCDLEARSTRIASDSRLNISPLFGERPLATLLSDANQVTMEL
jgi:hypothetical protein